MQQYIALARNYFAEFNEEHNRIVMGINENEILMRQEAIFTEAEDIFAEVLATLTQQAEMATIGRSPKATTGAANPNIRSVHNRYI